MIYRRLAPTLPAEHQDTDLELEPLSHQSAPQPTTTSRFRRLALAYSTSTHARLAQRKMKFSHSLLFNAVPDWNNHYLAYDALKAQIYKFEKSALESQQNGPPTSYRDDASADVEAGQADAAEAHKSANEKLFIDMLDKELNKITDFYVSKEKELLEDLVYLEEDLEKFREGNYSDMTDDEMDQRGRATSGASDSEDEEGDEAVEGNATDGDRNRFRKVLTNPREYDAAIRAGRKSERPANDRTLSGESTSKKGRSKSASKRTPAKGQPGSDRRTSATGDLLGMDDEEEDANVGSHDGRRRSNTSETLSSSGRRPSFVPQSSENGLQGGQALRKYRSTGKIPRMSSSFLAEDDGDVTGASDWAIDTKIMYKRRLAALFTSLSELKQFVDLNYTGLSKVTKKYDKITGSSLRSSYMSTIVDHTFPFESSTQTRLQDAISSIVPLYAELATNGNEDFAIKQLKAHLREHVVLERNTVWREMIGLERKGWSGRGGTGASRGISTDLPVAAPSPKLLESTEIKTPVGRFRIPAWVNQQIIAGGLATLLFFGILSAQWFDRVEEQNCLALLSFVTIFWALEIVPLFVTALFVPFLVVILRVIRSTDGEDRRLTSPEATKYIFSQMFSPTIMLLLGGFTLAAALSKQNIDKVLATKVLSFAGTRPQSVLFAYMCVACFASMWISNVAAPVLCYSLITPILRTLPRDSPFAKSLILGIALASNIGGMASPISSPQNLIALEYMNPPISWLSWFAVSIPVALLCIVIIWMLLQWSYRTGRNVVINPVRVNKEPWTGTQYFVSGVTLATIALWCIESKLSWLFGDMGIIAILPIVSFYGSGILHKADFDHSPWSIVFLAMGGIGLGKAVLSSGLLDDIDHVIERVVLGLDIWPILALFGVIVLIIATFISHTIAAVLVVPIAAQIGTAMDVPHPRLLIFATSLICSAGMGLPVSGFPNLQAISMEDDVGQPYLTPADFFKNGVPASIIATTIVVTLGYGIMRLLGL
ncbi:Pho91p [Sporobolomyces koalae]|uniref:Pho91p n=1 Tax=Sporobolomyces koalae TaxID=500713 RepID=UPI0031744708